MPNLGKVQLLELHFEQKTCPQALQWCWRVTMPKATRHRLQTSPSAHSGAVSASNMASASRIAGNFQPSAFIRLRVSYGKMTKGFKNQSVVNDVIIHMSHTQRKPSKHIVNNRHKQ